MKKSQFSIPLVIYSALVKKFGFMLIIIVLVYSAFSFSSYANQTNKEIFPNLQAETMPDSLPYLGQPRPDTIPLRFGPSYLISNGTWTWHGSPKFSPDGKEMFFVKYYHNLLSGEAKIYIMNDVNGEWTLPAPPVFASDSIDNSPVYSEDGDTLYFASRRDGSLKIYYVTRTYGGWSQPQLLNMTYQSLPGSLGWDFSFSRNSTIYFSLFHSVDGVDIYKSNLANGQYSQFEKLPVQINTSYQESTPYIDPDEQYMIFTSNRPGSYGLHDIYISFKDGNDTWTAAQNMGNLINGTHEEAFPWITFDGKYMFFNSAKTGDLGYNAYWVDSRVIDKFRPPIGINEERKTTPQNIQLFQNYPNPFNSQTLIRVEVAASGTGKKLLLRLAIYDVTGAEIAVLLDGALPAGTYSAFWNAGSNTSGIYFCRIETENYVSSKKMVLLK